MSRSHLPLFAAILLGSIACTGSAAQDLQLDVFPDGATGSEDWQYERVVVENGSSRSIYNTREPRLEVFLPDSEKANGAAAIILPGGGLRVLGRGPDTEDLISRLLAEGVAAIHLEYRTLQVPPDRIPRPTSAPTGDADTPPPAPRFPKLEIVNANANPARGNAATDEVLRLATSDAQETLRIVRRHADQWRIDPAKVGMIGTSAGGGVAIGALLAGVEGATPDWFVSIYGPALEDVAVPADAPPIFLATEAEHGPVTDGLVALYEMWREAGKSAELHIYAVPTFDMPVSLWGDRMVDWMREQAILPPAASRATP